MTKVKKKTNIVLPATHKEVAVPLSSNKNDDDIDDLAVNIIDLEDDNNDDNDNDDADDKEVVNDNGTTKSKQERQSVHSNNNSGNSSVSSSSSTAGTSNLNKSSSKKQSLSSSGSTKKRHSSSYQSPTSSTSRSYSSRSNHSIKNSHYGPGTVPATFHPRHSRERTNYFPHYNSRQSTGSQRAPNSVHMNNNVELREGNLLLVPKHHVSDNSSMFYYIEFNKIKGNMTDPTCLDPWFGGFRISFADINKSIFEITDGRLLIPLDSVAADFKKPEAESSPSSSASAAGVAAPSSGPIVLTTTTDVLPTEEIDVTASQKTIVDLTDSAKASAKAATVGVLCAPPEKQRINSRRKARRFQKINSEKNKETLKSFNLIPIDGYLGQKLCIKYGGKYITGVVTRCEFSDDPKDGGSVGAAKDSKISKEYLESAAYWVVNFHPEYKFLKYISYDVISKIDFTKCIADHSRLVALDDYIIQLDEIDLTNDHDNVNDAITAYSKFFNKHGCVLHQRTQTTCSKPPLEVVTFSREQVKDSNQHYSDSINNGTSSAGKCSTISASHHSSISSSVRDTFSSTIDHSPRNSEVAFSSSKHCDEFDDKAHNSTSSYYSCFLDSSCDTSSLESISSINDFTLPVEDSPASNKSENVISSKYKHGCGADMFDFQGLMSEYTGSMLDKNLLYLKHTYDCDENQNHSSSSTYERSLVVMFPRIEFANRRILSNQDITSTSKETDVFRKIICVTKKRSPLDCPTELLSSADYCTIINVKGLAFSPHFQVGSTGKRILQNRSDCVAKGSNFSVQIIGDEDDYVDKKDDDVKVINTAKLYSKLTSEPVINGTYHLMKRLVLESNIVPLILFGNRQHQTCPTKDSKQKRGRVMQLHIGSTMNNPRSYVDNTMVGGSSPTLHGYRHLSEHTLFLLGRLQKYVLQNVFSSMECYKEFRSCHAGEKRCSHSQQLKALHYIDDKKDKMEEYILFEAETFGMSPPNSIPQGTGDKCLFSEDNVITPYDVVSPHVDTMNCSTNSFDNTVIISVYVPISDFEDEDLVSALKRLGYQEYIEFTNIKYSRKCIGEQDLPSSKLNKMKKILSVSPCAVTKTLMQSILEKNDHSWNWRKFATDCNHLFNVVDHMKRELLKHSKLDWKKIGSDYKYGVVFTGKKEGMDKMGYYSSVIDIIFSVLVHFRLELCYDDLVDLVMMFSFYCNGPSLFIQALESIMNLLFLGTQWDNFAAMTAFASSERDSNSSNKDNLFFWMVSAQMAFCKSSMKSKVIRTGASTENRHQHSTIKLPHLSKTDWANWKIIRNLVMAAVSNVWKNSFPSDSVKIHSEKGTRMINELAQIIMSIFESTKIKVGVGRFGLQTFIQISSAVGILPIYLQTFAELTFNGAGSSIMFSENVDDLGYDFPSYSKEKQRQLLNDKLMKVTATIRKFTNHNVTKDKIENLSCALGRKKRKIDPIYIFGFRQDILSRTSDHATSTSLQNFFITEYNKKTREIELKMFYGTQYGGKATMNKRRVSDFVKVDGKKRSIAVKKGMKSFPFNAFSAGSDNIHFFGTEPDNNKFQLKHPNNYQRRDEIIGNGSTNKVEKPKVEHGRNVLLLAMSYTSVPPLEKNLDSILNLVQRKKISEMDGRDLYRIIKTESDYDLKCYTVSRESCDHYDHRHFCSDCSARKFVTEYLAKYPNIKFVQIVFDWFWFPVSWFSERINIRFFSHTIIEFAIRDMVSGSIFLPFNIFFLENIVAHERLIEKYYHIQFLKHNSKKHSCLWRSTMDISDDTINLLGKEPNQENTYCVIPTESELKQKLDGKIIHKNEVMMYVKQKISDVSAIRIIRLKRKNK